ncbi:lytic transglycosylase domain-containing protein [Klebsiella aerogenes]|uniref:lytic transglycosylase domain-containing protein n=1 Tax=Klebsiella aerogenes TaxID=548 RepID=UPI001D82B5C2|nr:lytic transglycosylase domain-containing protein [Klebsiella aerogenes]MCB8448224.1 lytic transglycosylase domain-containing protein [Klebsiella aerogenes]MCB8452303.1 lytic transglycosylase domain-containing protein [Klebsiella aerogenes]
MATYRELLEQAGARHGIPEGLMTQLGGKESSYRPDAVSSKGARGLTQVMPDTYRGMGYTDEQMQNPEYQADAGARYLSQMYQRFGNWRDALQAYHDGPGNVEKAKRGEYTPGPEGRQYVDNRFSQWTGDPSTNNDVEQRATSAKLHPQQDPDNPFAQIESQATGNPVESHVQDDPNNPFAQIEQQSETTQQPVQQQTQQPQQGQLQEQGFMSDLGNAVAETGRGLLQAGVNVVNIPASVADAVTSAGAWAGKQLGIGDGTYMPAPRVTTQGLEQGIGLQQGTLTPQTTEGKIFSEALPYLTPVGIERAASQAPTVAGRIAEGASRLLAENSVGSLAANSQQDNAENLATDLGLGVATGGLVNAAGRGISAAYRGARGAIAPEAQQAIRFAEQEGVPLHTTDVLQPQSRIGRMAQTTAENIPFAGTSSMRATQQEARSQLVQDYAARFGEYDPSIVVGSLKAKSAGIKQAAGNRLEQVQNAMSGVNIQPVRAIQHIDDEISSLGKLGRVADQDTIAKLQAYRDELATGKIDLQQLSGLRSQFRQDVKGERMVMPTRSDAAIQRVYRAMTGDIDSAIGQNLGNDTLRRYKQANAIYADEANKLQNTRLKNVLMKGDLTPEVVNNMLFSKNKSEVQNLYNSVGRIGRAQMRNGIIGKAMEKSDGSPDQFLRQLNIMSNQTGIAFKGQDAAYIKGLKNYLDSTRQASKAAVTTPTGQQTIPFILGIGSVTNPALIGVGGGYGILARIYESEAGRNAMLRLANTPRGSTAFESALADAQRVINAIAQGAKSEALSE